MIEETHRHKLDGEPDLAFDPDHLLDFAARAKRAGVARVYADRDSDGTPELRFEYKERT